MLWSACGTGHRACLIKITSNFMARISHRTRTLVLLALIAVCIGVLVFVGMRGNIIYYYSVSEAVTKAPSQGTGRFRIAGQVVDGSVVDDGETVTFQITDGEGTVGIIHRGDPPQLFEDGAPVVAEGHWKKGQLGKKFESDRLLIKHGNEYTPPDVDGTKTSTTSPL